MTTEERIIVLEKKMAELEAIVKAQPDKIASDLIKALQKTGTLNDHTQQAH